ncbi:hypothetical protein DFH11DRAFT_407800 [Phellopilus nigrolimitatus]|nr:hypothetical protein DFH11DRAFT_407800 [Phellopilus nigrolimitatus]
MSSHPTYTISGQTSQRHPSNHSSTPRQTSYSSTPAAQAYHVSQPSMPQSYGYYTQPNYEQNTQLQQAAPLGAASLHPLPFQAYPAHSGKVNVAQIPQSYPPVQQQAYGYNASAYPPPPSHSHAHLPLQGHSLPSEYQRHSSSSTIPSSPTPSSQSSSSTDRFPCPHCDKSFTRNFDRKRHMEIHVPGSSGSNRCRYCVKDYSRPDSLKRHLDNGCEKKPRS